MQPLNDTAVFSVVFPSNEVYLNDFAESLKAQTQKDFDLVLINDGLPSLPKSLLDLNPLVLNYQGSIASIRRQGLELLSDLGHSYIIFADSDDQLKNNRVEVVRGLLNTYHLVANDLDMMDDKGKMIQTGYWGGREELKSEIRPEFLEQQNIFGLGNTGIRAEILQPLEIPEELEVVDWFIFLKLFSWEYDACFTSKTSTLYRIRENNLGSIGEVNQESIERTLKVKQQYYSILSKRSKRFKELKEGIDELAVELSEQKNLKSYITQRAKNLENPFWWEEVMVN